jgi:C4-dicarboxylate-specific signal transduction histidine kinase
MTTNQLFLDQSKKRIATTEKPSKLRTTLSTVSKLPTISSEPAEVPGQLTHFSTTRRGRKTLNEKLPAVGIDFQM